MTIRNKSAVVQERDACLKNGWLPLPIYNAVIGDKTTGKRPHGTAWEQTARAGKPIPFIPAATNTGILCDNLFAIDVDLNGTLADAPILSSAIENLMDAKIGPAPTRRRNGSSRFLRVYRVAHTEREQKKIKIANKTTGHAIEVLATGQQFVAFGSHFEHGASLDWDGDGSPTATGIADIPELTENQVFDFLDDCQKILNAEYTSHGARTPIQKQQKQAGSARPQSGQPIQPQTKYQPMPWDRFEELVSCLPTGTNESYVAYDIWYLLLASIYNTGISENYDMSKVRCLAEAWYDMTGRQGAPAHDLNEFDDKWTQFQNGGAPHHNLGYLINQSIIYEQTTNPISFPTGYYMNAKGLHYQPEQDMENKTGEVKKPMFLTSHFEIIGETTSATGNETGILIKFMNRHIEMQDVINKNELHSVSQDDFVSRLAGKGLTITPVARKYLTSFFIYLKAPHFIHTNKAGWHNKSFLLSEGSTFNPPDITSPVIMNPGKISPNKAVYGASGSLDGWRTM